MHEKQKQVKNSIRYTIVMVISGLLPLVTLPIFTRILTKEDFGILVLSEIYAVLVTGLVFMGLTAIYDCDFFKYKRSDKEFSQLLSSILLFVLFNFCVFAGLTYLWKTPLSQLVFQTGVYGNFLFIYFCAVFFDRLGEYYLSYFRNSEDAKSYSKYIITLLVFNSALAIYLVAFLRTGVIGIVYAKLFSAVVLCLFLSFKIFSVISLSFSRKILLESLKTSYPLVPKSLFKVAGTKIDKYMINLLASLGGVGIYGIGQRISYLGFAFMTALEQVFKPQMYKKMFDLKEDGGAALGKYLMPFAYISIFGVLCIGLFAEEVVSLLVPSSFHGTIDIVSVLSMYYGFLFFSKLTSSQFVFAKKTHVSTMLTFGTYAVNIGLNLIFILKWGAIGAAWATFLAGLISGTVTLIIAQRYYFIRWQHSQLVAIFLTAFVAITATVILRNIPYDYSFRLIGKCMALGIYAYIGVKLNVISKDNFDLLKSIFLKQRDLSAGQLAEEAPPVLVPAEAVVHEKENI